MSDVVGALRDPRNAMEVIFSDPHRFYFNDEGWWLWMYMREESHYGFWVSMERYGLTHVVSRFLMAVCDVIHE